MRRFALGLVGGLSLGSAAAAYSAAAIFGDGPLSGWIVTVEGEPLCHDPYAHQRLGMIDCLR